MYHLCLFMSEAWVPGDMWMSWNSQRWQVKTVGLLSVSATWSPASFCFPVSFLVSFKIVSLSKWRRVFLLFFSYRLVAWLHCCKLITHSSYGSFLGAFWCRAGDSSKLWLRPWKLQLDHPVPLWESVLRLWVLFAYHTPPGNSEFSLNNSAFWLFNPNSEYKESSIPCF